MVYKKYYINIFIRISLILMNCLLFSFVLSKTNYLYTIIFIGILLLIQFFSLLKYINQSNIFLERFLIYLKENNTTLEFSKSLENTPFKVLSNYFNEINSIIQDAKIEKENQYLYLQYIFNHLNIGLISFNSKLEIKLINAAAKKLLNLNALKSIYLLDKINKNISKTITSLGPGEQKILAVNINGKNVQLSIKLSKFKLLDQEVSLISLYDIKPELDYKEIESWQKLNRVLTHEIMNSVSPIIGLTNNVTKLLKKDNHVKKLEELNTEIIEQTVQSLNIIVERSQGLSNFVKKFRSITTSIIPEPKHILVQELFEDISLFMYEIFQQNNINFSYTVNPENLELFADRKLIEQVLINLLKNSTEAFKTTQNKFIRLCAEINESDQKIIEVIDNGCGILENEIDLIFTPFYTSKETGSGVGLSLSRNILKQHGFNIDVKSVPNIETIFTLYF